MERVERAGDWAGWEEMRRQEGGKEKESNRKDKEGQEEIWE